MTLLFQTIGILHISIYTGPTNEINSAVAFNRAVMKEVLLLEI